MQSNICLWLHAGHSLTGRLYPSMMAIAQQRRASWQWPVGMAGGCCKALRRALREVLRIGEAHQGWCWWWCIENVLHIETPLTLIIYVATGPCF